MYVYLAKYAKTHCTTWVSLKNHTRNQTHKNLWTYFQCGPFVIVLDVYGQFHTKTETCTSTHMHKHTHTNAHSHKYTHTHIHTQLLFYSKLSSLNYL